MAGSTDGKYPFQAEVPFQFRFQERQDETTGSGIHMDRNVVACLCIVCVECSVQCFHVVVQTCPGYTLDGDDTDGVFITILQGFLRVECDMFLCQWHLAHFDLPQLGEFFPYYLESGRDNEVRFVGRFALCYSSFAPTQPGGNTTQHTCFGRTDGQGSGFPLCLFGAVPQVSHDVDTFSIHHSNTRILSFVDIVDVDCFVHQLCCIIIHPGGNECSQVQTGLCLGESFVFYHLISNLRSGRTIRDYIYWSGMQHCIRAKNRGFGITFSKT